jgi:SAM-dependent methyltransferase
MEALRLDRGSAYWDSVIEDQLSSPQPAWRAYVDTLHQELVVRWLSGIKPSRLLKTDLYEEAVGNGLISILRQPTVFAVGMDVSPKLVKVACRRYSSLHCLAADSRKLPFAEDSFDGILSISTLDHFASIEGIELSLSEFSRVLRPKGVLVLTLDNPENPLIALRQVLPFRLLNRLRIVPYYVGYTCGPSKLRDLLSKNGFGVAEMTAVVHCPRALAIPLAAWLDRYGSEKNRARLNKLLHKCEALAAWPTRFRTGHFIAVKAIRGISSKTVRAGYRFDGPAKQ